MCNEIGPDGTEKIAQALQVTGSISIYSFFPINSFKKIIYDYRGEGYLWLKLK